MGDLNGKLKYLDDTKQHIRRAIIAKGVEVGEKDAFYTYADKIRRIPTERDISTTSLNVTANGEYSTKDNDRAYSEITVDVKPSTKTKSITEPGEYEAQKDDECDGYSEVTVNISSHVRTFNIDSTNLPEEPEDGYAYDAKDDPTEGTIAYDEVVINLSGMFGEKVIEIDPTTYGETFTYKASDDKLYGYSQITVRLVEGQGPFTVKFWVDRNLKYETKVEKYGDAQYVGDIPTKPGKMFAGWDPEPTNVIKNLDCYALFDNEEELVDDNGNILIGWDKIANTGGANIPVGSHKIISGSPLSYDEEHDDAAWSTTCYKVYEGEQGTTSTWAFNLPFIGRIYLKSMMNGEGGPYRKLNFAGYEGSDLRNIFLETQVYPSMGKFAKAIKPVTKYTYSYDIDTSCPEKNIVSCVRNMQSSEKLFVPSYYECTGKTSYETMGTFSDVHYKHMPTVPFYRTNRLDVNSNYQTYNHYGERRRANNNYPYEKIICEFGRFITPGNSYDLNGYAYVWETFDNDFAAEHGGTKYSEYTGGAPTNTRRFTSVTICFCT